MSTSPGPGPGRPEPSLREEARSWGRSAVDDLADELRTAALFLAAMVPAGLLGYLVDGVAGAFVGAVVGAALVVVWVVVGACWSLVRAVRRRRTSGGGR